MQNSELLENYEKGLGSKGVTRNLYLGYARDFLDYANDNLDRETISKYLEHLRHNHRYSDGSINFIFRIVRTLFNRNNLEWPFRRGEAPQIRENNVIAPALDPDVIIEMIDTIKTMGEADERAFLALSTTYGLRKEEMVQLTTADVNTNGKTIHIATVKYGRERTHLIPDEIIPYLEQYDFSTKISDSTLYTIWYRIEYKIGMKHIDQVCWHSVRRTVDTLLADHLPPNTIRMFLRWKKATSSDMVFRYSALKFVGKEGTTTKVIGEARDVDTKVFEVHPFLKYWGS